MAGNKKYKLFSSAQGTKVPCAFFNSPSGCRNGDDCKFLHSTAAQSPVLSTTEVVSSESDSSSSENEAAAPVPQKMQNVEKKTKKRKSSSHGDQIFAKPHSKEKEEKKGKEGEDDDEIFSKPEKKPKRSIVTRPPDAPAKAIPSSEAASSTTTSITRSARKKKTNKLVKSPSGPVDFRKLNLPIAAFSVLESGTSTPAKQEKSVSSPEPESVAVVPASVVAEPKNTKCVLPESSLNGRKWKDLVEKSQAHPEFASIFDFKKYKEQSIPGDTWIESKPYGDWCANNPQAIAVDCEMCETTDPVSGQKNYNALCRISVINAEDPDEVLLDTLVKPSWPVTNYRTFVNGVTQEVLDPVQFTLRHAQAFMFALCSQETVIMGHAVHNDLAALRMEHYCVADSALLFKAKDSPTATVSLRDLAMNVMKKEMPNTHDSVNDALTALLCLDHYRIKKGDVENIERTTSNKNGHGSGRTHHQLFIHRIPKMCKAEHLIKMFQEHTSVIPEDVDEIEFTSNSGKTHVNFRSRHHAVLAFNTLEGAEEADTSGRMQKKVYLRNGDYVRVRKMMYERPDTESG